MSTIGREEVISQFPELDEESHITDFMKVGEAATIGLVSVDRRAISELVALRAGGVYNYAYMGNVIAAEAALSAYRKPALVESHFTEVESWLGESQETSAIKRLIDERIEQKRRQADELITGAEGLHLVIFSPRTADIDKQNREDPKGQGHRVAKLMGCVGYDSDATHFSFAIEGKSEDRYVVTPGKLFDVSSVMYPENKTYLIQPDRRILRGTLD